MPRILDLKQIRPSDTGKFKSKEEVLALLEADQKKIYDLLYLMFAHHRYSLLIILQGIDASGKDGVVRHISDCANPQGIKFHSFKQPSEEELRHDFIWRCHLHTPESGLTAIFNRSYYEEVTTARVHPEFLQKQNLPESILRDKKFFEHRYQCINDFEHLLSLKGTIVLKFFLHISKNEQKKRLELRLTDRTKNWKFSEADIVERRYWQQYQKSFQQMIDATDTKHAPWHVIPSNFKWYRDYLISQKIIEVLEKLEMTFPKNKQNKLKIF